MFSLNIICIYYDFSNIENIKLLNTIFIRSIILHMFKEIGIFVKEDSAQSTKNSALDSMINCILNCESNLYIDESSNYKNDNVKALSHKDLIEKVDLIIVLVEMEHY